MYARVEREELHERSDTDLVRLLKLGHDKALTHLLWRHSDALYRFCCHLTATREDAEDICQETLARAITRVETLQSAGAFRSWLFSIARNLAIDSYRSTRRVCPLPDEENAPVFLYDDNPQDRIEMGEEHATVGEALARLAQSHQRVLLLREVDGLSYAEIADEMEVSKSAVETLLFRARRRLKEEYSKGEAVPGLGVLGLLRGLSARLTPLTGLPLAKGALVTAVVLGGTAAATHRVLRAPHHGASFTHAAVASHHTVAQVQSHIAARHVAFDASTAPSAAHIVRAHHTHSGLTHHTAVRAHHVQLLRRTLGPSASSSSLLGRELHGVHARFTVHTVGLQHHSSTSTSRGYASVRVGSHVAQHRLHIAQRMRGAGRPVAGTIHAVVAYSRLPQHLDHHALRGRSVLSRTGTVAVSVHDGKHVEHHSRAAQRSQAKTAPSTGHLSSARRVAARLSVPPAPVVQRHVALHVSREQVLPQTRENHQGGASSPHRSSSHAPPRSVPVTAAPAVQPTSPVTPAAAPASTVPGHARGNGKKAASGTVLSGSPSGADASGGATAGIATPGAPVQPSTPQATAVAPVATPVVLPNGPKSPGGNGRKP